MNRKIALGAVAALLLGAGFAGCASNDTPAPAPTTAPAVPAQEYTPAPAPVAPAPAPAPKPEDTATASQKNALRKAENYISTMPFSKSGLIKQLQFEKYSAADSAWAVDHLTVDWNEQAVLKAKSYLDTMPFSRDGLISQLKFEGFTQAEAEAGVTGAGL